MTNAPTPRPELTKEQTQAIRCAFADLCGSLQAYQQQDIPAHDWVAHYHTIEELSQVFTFLDPLPTDIRP